MARKTTLSGALYPFISSRAQYNWNLLGDGVHTVQAFADGVEFANVTITVTTLGLGEFPTGLSGEFTLPDFPQVETETSIQWQQSQQNFVIVDVQ